MRPHRLLPLVLSLAAAGCLVNDDLYEQRYDQILAEVEGARGGARLRQSPDCIEVDATDLVLSGPFTFDAYIHPESGPGHDLYPVIAWPGVFALYQDTDGYTVASGTDDLETAARTPTSLMDGAYHHVAVSYGQNTHLSLYLDGRRMAWTPVEIAEAPGATLYLGCWPDQDATFAGDIGEARLSAVALYDEDFEPEWLPYEPSTATLALWHLDETSGSEVADAQGKAPGILVQGEWVEFALDGERP